MPGRQAHGRSLTAAPKARAQNKSKARSQKNALDAFGIAQENFSSRVKRTPRVRELDAEIERKHARDEDDEDEEDEEEAPRKKKPKPTNAAPDAEYGSDSEGNEWQLGGMAEDDEDSEIESDDAFGDSDGDKFEGYTFGGSKSKKERDDSDEEEDDSEDDEGMTLGADAIDLATALDNYESESDEPVEDDDSESDNSDGSSEQSESEDDDSDISDEVPDPTKMEALQGLVAGYGGAEPRDEAKPAAKQKISLADLGLSGISDPSMKKSVKLMHKEEKEKRPGAAKKLAVPLPRRQQDKIDRSAAYDKTNETLGRWTETVKHNRRADHLMFPLAQNSSTTGLNTAELMPLKAANPSNELESTIMSIMDQSGLSMEKEKKPKPQEFDEEGNLLTQKEVLARKRKQRELASRENKRAARIKKIKSKAYHRVHRKQRERYEAAAADENSDIDSEEEREAQDRRRALERVGLRHKDSKWAKIGSKNKRAVWDDDYRAGLTEMARKDEELRQRKEGRRADSDDESSQSGSDSDVDIRRKLDQLEQEEEQPKSGIMGLKFMQKAEAAKRKANDEMIAQIKKDYLEEGGEAESEDEEEEETGRRQYGVPGAKAAPLSISKPKVKRAERREDHDDVDIKLSSGAPAAQESNETWDKGEAEPTDDAWGVSEPRRRKKDTPGRADIDTMGGNMTVSTTQKTKAKSKPKPKSKPSRPTPQTQDDSDTSSSGSDSDSDAGAHMPLAIKDIDMLDRAFGGDVVEADFAREKEAVAEADDDKVIDNTLPGWGSWVGEGVSEREKKRHQGRFLTKVEGVKRADRKDRGLERVIISQKRVKKNDKYLASQLPHEYESRQQYERSLRVPVGPEWVTKETFQEATKPRVLMKQGVIAPMSKPMM